MQIESYHTVHCQTVLVQKQNYKETFESMILHVHLENHPMNDIADIQKAK